MRELIIQPATEGKGRSFRGTMVAYVVAPNLWEGGSSDNVRPVWAMFAGTENELRPFVANLRTGRKAEILGNGRTKVKVEMLKSAGFQCAWQRNEHGAVATVFEPDIFRLDPGMVDPKGITFCILPDVQWASEVKQDPEVAQYIVKFFPKAPGDFIVDLMRLAPLFIAYLDRRTRCPLIPDPRFYAQVLCGALECGIATFPGEVDKYYSHWDKPWGFHNNGFNQYNVSSVGIGLGIAMNTDHTTFESFLSEQVQLYFARVSS